MAPLLFLDLLLHIFLVYTNSVGVEGRGEASYSVIREATLGVDSLDDVLNSLPTEGGMLRLVYNNSEEPTVMKTLDVKNRRVAIHGQGSHGHVLTCNGNESAMRIIGGHVEVFDVAIHGCLGTAVEIVSPQSPQRDWTVQFHRCVFFNNSKAIKKERDEDGFPAGNLEIIGSEFISNTASAVELEEVNSLLISQSKFENNTARTFGGGGLSLEQEQHQDSWSLVVSESLFKGNKADSSIGGGILIGSCINGFVKALHTKFVGNTAGDGGGFAVIGYQEDSDKGHDFPDISVATLDCSFLNNKAVEGNGGGAFFVDIPSVTVEATLFKNCSSEKNGGGYLFGYIYNPQPWKVIVSRSVIQENRADMIGGGLCIFSEVDGCVTMQGTRFEGNTAIGGGAVVVQANENTSTLSHNFPLVATRFQSCTFSENSASEYGGGGVVFSNVSAVTVESTLFELCSSNLSGGAILFIHFYFYQEWVFSMDKSVFKDNTAKTGGGGVNFLVSSDGRISAKDTSFMQNDAGYYGGGLGVEAGLTPQISTRSRVFQNVKMDIFRCFFLNNKVVETLSLDFPNKTSVKDSGNSIPFDGLSSAVSLEGIVWELCLIGQCGGGGVYFAAHNMQKPWVLNFTESVFRGNEADSNGGALSVDGHVSGSIWIQDTVFEDNKAMEGGGIAATAMLPRENVEEVSHEFPDITVETTNCKFLNNMAKMEGGGVLFKNFTSGVINSGLFQDCKAALGGGGLAWYSTYISGVLRLTNSNFTRSRAKSHGGGVYFQDNGRFRVENCIFEDNESEGDGGGIYLVEAGMKTHDIILSDSKFVGNKALVGGVIYAMNVPHMVVEKVLFLENMAAVGGAVVLNPGSTASLQPVFVKSQFIGNVAIEKITQGSQFSDFLPFSGGGGAIAIISFFHSRSGRTTAWRVTLKSSFFKSNGAKNGGAILAISPEKNAESWLIIEECIFEGNYAESSGGAIVVDNPEEVNVACIDSEAPRSLQQISPAYCETWRGKQMDLGSGINDTPHLVAALYLRSIELNQSNVGKAESRPILPPIAVTTKDALNGSRSFGGIGEVEVIAACSDKQAVLFGATKQVFVNGIAKFTDLRLWGPPGNYTMTFNATNVIGLYKTNTVHVNLTVELRGCEIGERSVMEGGLLRCEHCNPGFFSFDPTGRTCEECIDHAECNSSEDNPVHPLVPKDGYWHSSPFSKQIHKCLDVTSCKYDGRKEKLQSFKAPYLPKDHPNYSMTDYPICKEGSGGPLCGSCEEGYGHAKNGQCKKCNSRLWSAFGLVAMALWTAFLMFVTISGNLASLKNEAEPEDIPLIDITHHEESDQHHSETDSGSTDPGNPSAVDEDCISGNRSVQLFKIAVNFFQVNGTALLLSYGWMPVLTGWLQFQDISTLASASSHGTWLAPECAIHSSKNRAIDIAYLDVALPFALLITFAASWVCFYAVRKSRDPLLKEVEVILWSGALYAYNSLTKSFMAMLSCIEVDKDDPKDLFNSYSNSKGLFWVRDTKFRCYHGSQSKHLLQTGFVGAVFFLIGLPLYLCIVLYRMKGRLRDDYFQKKYGFLFETYKNGYCFWEAVIMLRKFLVTTVGVFAASLGSQLQSCLMQGVMTIAVGVHLHARPFKDLQLNRMEAWSLITTCSTFYLIGVMSNLSTSWKDVLSLLVLNLNFVFCGVLIVNLRQSIVKEKIIQRALNSPLLCHPLRLWGSVWYFCVGIFRVTIDWVAWQLRDWI